MAKLIGADLQSWLADVLARIANMFRRLAMIDLLIAADKPAR